MALQIAIEREVTASEPRILQAVVEGKLQRSGRMELRRRLLEAMVSGRKSVSWEWRDGRLRSAHFRQGVDLEYPSPGEDWPSEEARILFDLWTDDVRYLARWPREAEQASGSFSFQIEEYSVPVGASYVHTDDTKRVDIRWEVVPPHLQEAARRAIQLHEQYRLGHCPISPFKVEGPPSQPPNRRNAIWGMLPAICGTAISALGAMASLTMFAWWVVLGSFLWGLVAVPLIGWFALNWSTATRKQVEDSRDAAANSESRQRNWLPAILIFIALFLAVLLLPAMVADVWLRDPEAVTLVMATIFGFMMFIWGGLLCHHCRPEPDLEPL